MTTARLEHREWLHVERDVPALASCSAQELLERGRELPGALRYTRCNGTVVLLGEERSGPSAPDEHVLDRLLCPLVTAATPTAEQIECALEASGLEWARRDQSWAATAGLRETRLTVGPGLVRLEAVLADWDEIAPECAAALAEFLLRAQASLCFARCEMAPTQARIVSQARAADLDAELPDALRGVTTACLRLAREAEALLRPELARAYRAFHG